MARLAASVLLQPELETASADPQVLDTIGEIEVRAQLHKILASSDFCASVRLHRLLAHIVDLTVLGRQDQLKGYSIAVDVFERKADFDQMNDPVVRIEAGKLRLALERYYLLSGNDDTIVIELPKGGYVARFTKRAKTALGSGPIARTLKPPDLCLPWSKSALLFAPTAALLLILAGLAWGLTAPLPRAPRALPVAALTLSPFVGHSAEATRFAVGLSEELLDRMVRVQGVTLLARSPPHATAWKRRMILEGSVAGPSGGRFVARWRLLDSDANTIIWAGTFTTDASENLLIESQIKAAEQILAETVIPLSKP